MYIEKKLVNEDIKRMKDIKKIRHRCKCGHSINIPEFVDKKICSWCGCYVFRTPQLEFEYRLKQQMTNQKGASNK